MSYLAFTFQLTLIALGINVMAPQAFRNKVDLSTHLITQEIYSGIWKKKQSEEGHHHPSGIKENLHMQEQAEGIVYN